jgi:hypothetical protein
MSVNLGEITSTTLRSRSSDIQNAWLNSTALLAKLKERGRYKKVSGGEDIVRPIEYAANSTAQRYGDLDVLNTTRGQIIDSVVYPWRQYAVAIVASGLETEIQNTGKEQVLDLLDTRIKNAEKSLIDLLVTDMYGNGTTVNAINGLGNLIADDPTTGIVGGINRASYSWWQNYHFHGVATGGAAVSATNIVSYLNTIVLNTSQGTQHPSLFLFDNTYYGFYWQACQAIQRLADGPMAKLGFRSLAYLGGDGECVYDGGVGGHATAAHCWAITPDTLELCYAAKRNFVPIGADRYSINQDAVVKLIGWAGNFCMLNSRFNGVLIA